MRIRTVSCGVTSAPVTAFTSAKQSVLQTIIGVITSYPASRIALRSASNSRSPLSDFIPVFTCALKCAPFNRNGVQSNMEQQFCPGIRRHAERIAVYQITR